MNAPRWVLAAWGCGMIALGIALPCHAAEPVRSSRPDPRPQATPQARAELIAKLRDAYAVPPAEWPAVSLDEGVEHRELGLLPEMAYPADNPHTEAKEKLGRLLFFDPRLSGSGQIACASCHDPDLAWADGRATSFGHDRTKLARNSPSIVNSGFRTSLFWDGRSNNLEQQATAVVENPDEMHSSGAVMAENLKAIPEYHGLFEEAFGADDASDPLSLDNAVRAIATFERSIVGGRSRFDRFLKGRSDALSDEALIGLHLFRGDARCIHCHNGPLLSDDKFHDLGLSMYGRRFEDLGRHAVTGAAEDVGRFRTPSLRNVMNSAPYMHNGLFDIDEVLRLYNAGMPNPRPRRDQVGDALFPTKSPLVKPLGLNEQDLADLKAFLASLSEPHTRIDPPRLPGM